MARQQWTPASESNTTRTVCSAAGSAVVLLPSGCGHTGRTSRLPLTPDVPAFALRHDASKYFEIHHTDADRLDRVDASDLAFNVAAYATVAWALADGPTRFAPLDRTWPTVTSGVQACEWRP